MDSFLYRRSGEIFSAKDHVDIYNILLRSTKLQLKKLTCHRFFWVESHLWLLWQGHIKWFHGTQMAYRLNPIMIYRNENSLFPSLHQRPNSGVSGWFGWWPSFLPLCNSLLFPSMKGLQEVCGKMHKNYACFPKFLQQNKLIFLIPFFSWTFWDLPSEIRACGGKQKVSVREVLISFLVPASNLKSFKLLFIYHLTVRIHSQIPYKYKQFMQKISYDKEHLFKKYYRFLKNS